MVVVADWGHGGGRRGGGGEVGLVVVVIMVAAMFETVILLLGSDDDGDGFRSVGVGSGGAFCGVGVSSRDDGVVLVVVGCDQ